MPNNGNLSDKIEEYVELIVTNIGGYDLTKPLPIDLGPENCRVNTILNTLITIDKVLKSPMETIEWVKFHWGFYITPFEVIKSHPFKVTKNNVCAKIDQLGFLFLHEFRGKTLPEKVLREHLNQAKDNDGIIMILNRYGFSLLEIIEIASYSMLSNFKLIIPCNRFDNDIEQALVIYILVKYGLIKNINVFYNEN